MDTANSDWTTCSGGGLTVVANTSAVIARNEFIGNTACVKGLGYGGALRLGVSEGYTVTLEDNLIMGNSASPWSGELRWPKGGGVMQNDGVVIASRNVIVGNEATQGGGIYISGSERRFGSSTWTNTVV